MDIRYLKQFEAHSHDLEELISVDADLTALAETLSKRALDMPEWLGEKLTEVDTEIKSLVRATRQASIKKKRAQLIGLMTNEEKRKRLEEAIAAEEALL